MKKRDQHNSKFKELKSFSGSLEEIDAGKLKGGFKSLGDLLSLNMFSNPGTCINSGTCTNSTDCSGDVNSGHCTNSGTCKT